MAQIDVVLAGLTTDELEAIRAVGPKGHLGRHLIAAIDRAAGGPGAGRGFYVLDGTVDGNGGQFYILRNDVSDRIFHPQSDHTASSNEAADHKVCRQDWRALHRGDRVTINQGTHHLGAGIVDDMTHDAAVVWVKLPGPSPRRMFHCEDPVELRADAHNPN